MRFYNYEVVLEREFTPRLGRILQMSVFSNGQTWAVNGPPGSTDGCHTPDEAIKRSFGRYGVLSVRKMRSTE